MTVKINLRNSLDPVFIEGDFADTVNVLNMAAARGHQFALFDEKDGGPVAVETRNITLIREIDDEEDFLA